MADNVQVNLPATGAPKLRYRPPLGLPLGRQGRGGGVVSVLLHLLIILLIFVPLFEHDVALIVEKGAGGLGPVGGGGGGNRGNGGEIREEHVRYFAVKPPAAPPAQQLQLPQPPKPVPPPPPKEIVPPVAKIDVKLDVTPPPVEAVAPVAGTGGGSGTDGTSGNGPGTGGGIGTGAGTGTGSANGPGTGGEGGDIYPPVSLVMLVPFDRPSNVQGKHVDVIFAIDEHGRVTNVQFASTGNRSFDKRWKASLLETTWRPAYKRDGTKVSSVYKVPFDL